MRRWDAGVVDGRVDPAAAELEEALADLVPTERVETLPEAVDKAAAMAEPGDCVLLAPACASFDMFSGFEARGEAFRASVQQLLAGGCS